MVYSSDVLGIKADRNKRRSYEREVIVGAYLGGRWYQDLELVEYVIAPLKVWPTGRRLQKYLVINGNKKTIILYTAKHRKATYKQNKSKNYW